MLWTTSFPMGPDDMKFTRPRSVFIELHHVQRLDSWLATSVHPSPSSLLGTLPPLLFLFQPAGGAEPLANLERADSSGQGPLPSDG